MCAERMHRWPPPTMPQRHHEQEAPCPSAFPQYGASVAPPALAASATIVLAATPAQAAGDGYVRLAHLSPDTPAVDVYLKSDSGAVKDQKFDGVAYGALSDYLRLPVGTYSVAMRKTGAAE